MIGFLVFVLGICSVICVEQKMWFLLVLVVLLGFIFFITIDKAFKKKNDELIIKKLCYVYALFDCCGKINNYGEARVGKMIKKVLKEIALEACGPGHYSQWVKWESYFRKNFEDLLNKKEEE